MKDRKIYRVFAFILLMVYVTVIFQEGVIQSIHFLSHSADIFSHKFSFHQHGNGKFHMHHHNLMDVMSSVLHHDEKDDDHDESLVELQQTKLHLPGNIYKNSLLAEETSLQYFAITQSLETRSPDVLTPPPKETSSFFVR